MENLQIDCCRHIEKDGHYMVDLVCGQNTYLTNYDWRLTSCVVLPLPSLAYAANDFGVVPSCGEDKSKSFTWAHKPDC